MRTTCLVVLAMLLGGFPSIVDAAAPTDARSYAIFAADDVSLKSYSLSRGDIYSGYNLTLDFSYGIQRPVQNVGDIYAAHNLATGGQCHVSGDIFANGDVSLDYWNEITGNVTYGGTLTYDDRGDIGGRLIHASGSVPTISLPKATIFSCGTQDISTSQSYDLQPGKYGQVTLGGLFKTLTLHSGNYYLESLTFTQTQYISLDLSKGPINVFVDGDISLYSGLDFYVNGTKFTDASSAEFRDLAASVLFESHGYVTIPGGFLNNFFGTIFAPNGKITANINEMAGQMIAGKSIEANVYMDFRPSSYLSTVPEPGMLTLLATAGIVLAAFARRKRK